MKNISEEEWVELLSEEEDPIIIDVRTKEEYEEGTLEGAVNLDIFLMREFISEIEKLDKTKNCFLLCRSGGRSGNACIIMDQLGFENTYNLERGIDGWTGKIIYSHVD